jgi:Trypsin-co-occurring domain 2
MGNEEKSAIGLDLLIAKVKQDLLSVTPGKEKELPMLFVDSVELELKVTVKVEGTTGVKIDVIPWIAGAELNGKVSRDDVHTVKVKLSPLFDKAQLLEWYKDLYPDKVLPAVKKSFDGLMKDGTDENPSDLYG